ncbi:hypothetical protein GCM10027074_64490 [Streptomyces deserti]
MQNEARRHSEEPPRRVPCALHTHRTMERSGTLLVTELSVDVFCLITDLLGEPIGGATRRAAHPMHHRNGATQAVPGPVRRHGPPAAAARHRTGAAHVA